MGPDKFQNITTILFDLDNTLINSKAADQIACEHVFHSLLLDGVRRPVARDAVDKFLLLASPASSLDGQWRVLQWRGALGPGSAAMAPAAAALWREARARALRPVPGLDDMLIGLRVRRYKLGLVAAGGQTARAEIEGAGLEESLFDALVVGEWGGALFEETFRRLDVAALECAIVCSDSRKGARARCGVVVCVDPEGGSSEEVADFVIRDLGQLPDLLPDKKGFASLCQDRRLGFFRSLRDRTWRGKTRKM